MWVIHTFGEAWDCLDASPFCSKLLAYVRLAGIEHKRRTSMDDIRKAPKGKMPYVTMDGEVFGDSTLIIDRLKARHGDPLNDGLTPAQRAVSHTAARMLDERTIYPIAHSRWLDDANWEQHTKPAFFGHMKQPMRAVLPVLLRRNVAKVMHGQGIGRHAPQDIYAFGIADLEALARLLGDRPYFFGDAPRELDTHAYAFLMSIVGTPCESPLRDFVRTHDTLMPYYQRMDALVRPTGD